MQVEKEGSETVFLPRCIFMGRKAGGVLAVKLGSLVVPLWAPLSTTALAELHFIHSLHCDEPADCGRPAGYSRCV